MYGKTRGIKYRPGIEFSIVTKFIHNNNPNTLFKQKGVHRQNEKKIDCTLL